MFRILRWRQNRFFRINPDKRLTYQKIVRNDDQVGLGVMAKVSTRKNNPKNARPVVTPGNWTGDVVEISAVHFGQEVQDGPPRQTMEFSYVVLSVLLKKEEDDFWWPTAVMITAPTKKMTARCDAGYLHQVRGTSHLSMSLGVSRAQFSDMLRSFDHGLPTGLYFILEDGVDAVWPVRSWGMTAAFSSNEDATLRSGL
ncbi:hypothetical protein ACSSV1_001722 [Labrenzia sp. MBR-25]